MEKQLRRIETEVDRYRRELVEKEEMESRNKERKTGRGMKERHWETMNWVVGFIEASKEELEQGRRDEAKEKEEEQRMQEWRNLTKEEKILKLREEERETRRSTKSNKEERLKTAITLKELWKKRNGIEEEGEELEEHNRTEWSKFGLEVIIL